MQKKYGELELEYILIKFGSFLQKEAWLHLPVSF